MIKKVNLQVSNLQKYTKKKLMMKHVSTENMDFVSSKIIAKEHAIRKSVKIFLGA